jgi:hypothetical protein
MPNATYRTPLIADDPSARRSNYDAVATEDGQPVQTSEYNIDISKKDFIWMLAGLWSM